MKIEEAMKQVMRVVAVFVCIEIYTQRPFLSSTATAFATTVRQARYLPLRSLRGGFWWLRKLCFTRSRPSEQSVIVPRSNEAVADLLKRNDFVPGWMLSYNYRDEILNVRRIERFAHPSGFEWWQVHVRGYAHVEGIELTAHFEPEPRRHPRAHITLFGLDIDRGMETLLELLERHEIEYDWLNNRSEPHSQLTLSSRSV